MDLLSQEPAGEKGILEQSQITLVSVTDTTVDEPDTTVTDEAAWGDKDPDASEETEVTKTNSIPDQHCCRPNCNLIVSETNLVFFHESSAGVLLSYCTLNDNTSSLNTIEVVQLVPRIKHQFLSV